MIKRFFKWLDHKVFPIPTANDYKQEALDAAELELAKALDQRDYTQAMVTYREAQIARLTTKGASSTSTT